jgi:non-specific serine/threonine protein kinase
MAAILIELGHVQFESGSAGKAIACLREAVALAQRSGEQFQLARALEGLARCSAAQHPASAVRLAAAADRARSVMGAGPWPSDKRRRDGWLPELRHTLGPRHFRAAWSAGQAADMGEIAGVLGTFLDKADPPSRPEALTSREQQVVALLGRAQTVRQIAAQLSISPATARTHVEHAMAKLGLHSRAQVVLWANDHVHAAFRNAPEVRQARVRSGE